MTKVLPIYTKKKQTVENVRKPLGPSFLQAGRRLRKLFKGHKDQEEWKSKDILDDRA